MASAARLRMAAGIRGAIWWCISEGRRLLRYWNGWRIPIPICCPTTVRLAQFDFAGPVAESNVAEYGGLPADWIGDENATRRIGARWRQGGSTCLLAVPSAILPEESNFVINPQHTDARRLRLVKERRFAFDARSID
jgi:hypothetical protein